jgi:transcriptional regulator with XRE-family HTH domain
MSRHMDANQTTAANIRAALARRRMSGRELSEQLERSPMWVQRRMAGTSPISVNDLELIAGALGLEPADLLAVKAAS